MLPVISQLHMGISPEKLHATAATLLTPHRLTGTLFVGICSWARALCVPGILLSYLALLVHGSCICSSLPLSWTV